MIERLTNNLMVRHPMPARPTQYRWPSERHRTPTHCGHCGARLLLGDIPTADHPVTDATCWQCSRVACELVLDGARGRLTPEQWRALPNDQGRRSTKWGKP